MAKKSKSKGTAAKGRTIKVDFSNVKEGGGGGVRVKEGKYPAKVVKVDLTETKSSGESMLVVHFKIKKGGASDKAAGKVIKDNIVLVEQSLFRLFNLLRAMGKKVPKKVSKLNIDNLIGEDVGIEVVDGDEYKNRIKSEVIDYISLDELDEDEDEDDDDDEDEDEDEDDDDEDDEDEDLDELDVDEL